MASLARLGVGTAFTRTANITLDRLSGHDAPAETTRYGNVPCGRRRQISRAASLLRNNNSLSLYVDMASGGCASWHCGERSRKRLSSHMVRADGTDSPDTTLTTSHEPKSPREVTHEADSDLFVGGASGLLRPMDSIEVVGSLQEAEMEAWRVLESLQSESSGRGLELLREGAVVEGLEVDSSALLTGHFETEQWKVPVIVPREETDEVRRNDEMLVDEVLKREETVEGTSLKEAEDVVGKEGDMGEKSLWDQMKRIAAFAGPALGIWLSSPIMGIIDTAVVGNSSSLELAALGPGTVLCDQLAYVYMFLSIATSNLIATSLAKKDKAAAAGYLARLLCVGVVCGVAMIGLTELFVTPALSAFVGGGNQALIPAARSYVRIRSLAWPAILVTNIAQSASLGMQDSWGPLKVLLVASAVNAGGDLLLCTGFGQGIAGAAWATMASQWVGMVLMLKLLHDLGKIPVAIKVPSVKDLIVFIKLGGPVLLTMLSKVSYFTFLTYLATSLGTLELAAHQVVIGVFGLVSVWGEPLCQTAQSFMPPLLAQNKRKETRSLVKSLLAIGASVGMVMGALATSLLWVCPLFFTRDPAVIARMQSISLPLFLAVLLTPATLSLEGSLLATQEFGYFSKSMATAVIGHAGFLMIMQKIRPGLLTNWCCLVLFQLTRFISAGLRVRFANVIFNDSMPLQGEEHSRNTSIAKTLKAA